MHLVKAGTLVCSQHGAQITDGHCHFFHLGSAGLHLVRLMLGALVRRHGLHLLHPVGAVATHHGLARTHLLMRLHVGIPLGTLCRRDLQHFCFAHKALLEPGLTLLGRHALHSGHAGIGATHAGGAHLLGRGSCRLGLLAGLGTGRQHGCHAGDDQGVAKADGHVHAPVALLSSGWIQPTTHWFRRYAEALQQNASVARQMPLRVRHKKGRSSPAAPASRL